MSGGMRRSRRSVLLALGAAGMAAAIRPSALLAAEQGLLTKPIPSSGEALPLIGLGSWITFNVGDDAVARDACTEVMGAFFAAGGRMIDSSPMYGSSQAVIGNALAALGHPKGLFSADKVWTSAGEDGPEQIEESRKHLGRAAFRSATSAQPPWLGGASADALRHESGRAPTLCRHHHLAWAAACRIREGDGRRIRSISCK